CMQSIKDPFTF
nr:immunoglobulin light chain junction region [Macaca mulatta]MOV77917.1 immunoglobulin light chain junction region [Macaca mulatta]MOV78233.1 immunoglobulin light chain junction region [Macaca mulatta]MOV78270.1 immunoglobulin light chain junction region [Macaca mulatta]MOV78626.1 immunoglobulin light chain junction region [Macaca mulatta]